MDVDRDRLVELQRVGGAPEIGLAAELLYELLVREKRSPAAMRHSIDYE